MSISKQSLPKRVISLLLAVAIMIGFVPLIDIDLTAFAATYSCIELDDSKPQSGDNWVWDNTSHTLSLYNAKITCPARGSYAIKYDGTDTLKINQIGYNRIENGYIQANAIEVVGSGILDISHDSCYMFNTPELNITNGYVRSDNAVALNSDDNETTTVSNCVLDIPQAKIVAYAQQDSSTAGFIMESSYVNCKTLDTKMSAVSGVPSAEIKGGYLKVGTIEGENNGQSTYYFVKLGTAVVKADTLTGAAGYLFSGGNQNPTTLELNGSTLLIKNTDSLSPLYNSPQKTIGDYKAYYGTRIGCAKYYGNDTTLAASLTTDTIVCDNNLTLNEVDTIPAGTTIYCSGTLNFNYTHNTYGMINGCLIGKVTLGGNATVGNTGRIYGESLTLNGNATIAEGGAVTVYNSDGSTKCLNFNSKSLTVNGDFSVKNNPTAAEIVAFKDTEKNITVGAAGQFAAVGDVDSRGGGFDSAAVYNAITTGNDTSRTVYASNSYHNNAMDCKKYDNPNTVYIGKEFNPQLISLDSTQIICKKVYEDSADLNFLCSHNIENFSDVNVTIKTGGSGGAGVTDKFNIQKSYSDTTEADKTKIKITLSLKEDIDAKGYTVAVTVDGLMATSTLTAKNINTTLDFTQTNASAWEFFGAFGGTSAESKAANDMWAWYPNGAEGYTGKVLVLNGLDIETTASNAIIVPADTTIVVKGENKIHSRFTAIYGKGKVDIIGDDHLNSKLTVKSDNASRDYFAAIQSDNNVTIKDLSKLTVEMGEARNDGWGSNSGAPATNKKSYGIYGQWVKIANISNGSITAGTADESAAIVSSGGDIKILSNCTISLKAEHYALKSSNNLSLSTPLIKLDNAYKSDLTAQITKDWYNNEVATNPSSCPCNEIYTKDSSTETIVQTKAKTQDVRVYVTGLDNGTVSLGSSALTGFTPMTDPTSGYKTVTVNDCLSTKFTFEANTDCYISEIKYDNADITNKLFNVEKDSQNRIVKADYRIDSVEEEGHYIEVTFVNSNIRTLTVNSPNGTVNLSPDAQSVSGNVYTYNRSQSITAAVTPNPGYKVTSVTLDNNVLTAVNGTYTIGTLSADSTLTVTYEQLKYSVNLPTTTPNGSLSNNYNGSLSEVPHDTQIEFTATPDSGYKLSNVKVNGQTISTSGSTFTVTVTENTQIEVTFTKTNPSGGGSGGSGGNHHNTTITTRLPALDGTGYSYARMAEVLATYKTGSTATIEVNGNYNVPEAVIKAIANGKLKVTLVMSSTVRRYIDGADIETAKSVDADIRVTYSLDTDELSGNEAMQLILFNFDVPSDLIVDLNAKNAGLFANLYKYTNGKFEFAECAKINKDGKAVFEDYTTSGTYAIMLSEYSAKPGDVNNDGKLNAADATAVLRYVVKLDGNYTNLSMADLDSNRKINARDALLILKRVVGLI